MRKLIIEIDRARVDNLLLRRVLEKMMYRIEHGNRRNLESGNLYHPLYRSHNDRYWVGCWSTIGEVPTDATK
jgi:hypothetical protein